MVGSFVQTWLTTEKQVPGKEEESMKLMWTGLAVALLVAAAAAPYADTILGLRWR